MGNLNAVRILIADDHTLVRESLVNLLQGTPWIQVVAQASDGLETVEKALATRPDRTSTALKSCAACASPCPKYGCWC